MSTDESPDDADQVAPPPADLAPDTLAESVGDRPLRSFAEITSTEAEALRWVREGAPPGALVVAGHQASPRGRSGLSWGELLERGHGLGFSLVLRDDTEPEGTGWRYLAGLLGLVEGLDHEALTLEWPDQVRRDGGIAAALSVRPVARSIGRHTILNVVVPGAEPPRTELLGRLVAALQDRLDDSTEAVLSAYRERCGTLGRRVRARLLPLGPSATTIVGVAADVRDDGALVIEDVDGDRVVVPPTELGFLEDPDEDDAPPDSPVP